MDEVGSEERSKDGQMQEKLKSEKGLIRGKSKETD